VAEARARNVVVQPVETGIGQRGEDNAETAPHTPWVFAGVLDRFQNRARTHRMRTTTENRMPGNRNIMFLIIGALIVAVGVLGYNLYQTKKEPEGLQINVGPNGLKIQNK
jgi:hypothetical protein